MPGHQATGTRITTCLATGLILTAAAIGVGAFSAAEASHSVSAHYSEDENCEGGRIDPIGAIFRGEYGGANQVADAIANHAEWTSDDPGVGGLAGDQGLRVRVDNPDAPLQCKEKNDTERSSEDSVPTPTERHHIRLWGIPATSGNGRTTVGTPHYEVATTRGDCGTEVVVDEVPGHAVTPNGFDQARHTLKQLMQAGGHDVAVVRWGNTKRVQQCTGEYAHSSGNVIRVRVDHPPND